MKNKKKLSPTALMPADYKPTNTATITDYDRSVLSGPIKKMRVGQSVRLVVNGEVTRLEEKYSKGKDYFDNRCEVQLTPTSVSVSGPGSMVSEVNSERKKRGGGYYGDEEDD